MRRLPGILLLTGAALVVIAALLVSGLRIALPHLGIFHLSIMRHLNSYRNHLWLLTKVYGQYFLFFLINFKVF